MTPEQSKRTEYQEQGFSAEGRAFLEALVRRKRARGEEVPPLYQKLLEAAPNPPSDEAPFTGEARTLGLKPPHDSPFRAHQVAVGGLAAPAGGRAELTLAPPPAPEMRPSVLHLVDRALEGHPEVLESLSPTARRAYRLLLALGLELTARQLGDRPLPKNLSQVVAFTVNRALAAALGVSEATLYRALAELEEAVLVRRRAWRTPSVVHGRAGLHAAGAVYAVRLPHRSRRPRLEREDFAHPWRDLEGDIARGRTAWKAVRECKENPPKEGSGAVEFLLGFALPPQGQEAALAIHSLTARLRQARGQEKRLLVAQIALGLAREFKDPGSVKFYAWLLWGALRAEIYGLHERALEVVLWAVGRVREALAASLWGSRGQRIRRPGALLASLLSERGLVDLFRRAPAWRVA
ncbi:hypothetical protein [Thermus brockianus]|uniref:Replication protein n=1 Tax=Thermus brockianus TaxID=56956 RepID=A0ABN6NLU0_THEBO|nr:hypothetical protein [Thermus brockianus]BDG17783.1 hypothetical protein TbrSNM41_25170 [Thermus brockianus]